MDAESKKRQAAVGVEPQPDLVAEVKRRVADEGEGGVAKVLGVSRGTVARLRGGLPCRAATIAWARIALGLGAAS